VATCKITQIRAHVYFIMVCIRNYENNKNIKVSLNIMYFLVIIFPFDDAVFIANQHMYAA
jgi:hypothetical protein